MRRLVLLAASAAARLGWSQRKLTQQRQGQLSGEKNLKIRGPRRKGKLTPCASALQRSVDIASAEEQRDVEKHFPVAMSHIKATPTTRSATEERRKQSWKDITQSRHPDGYYLSKNETSDAPPSFFDEGGVDIRRDPSRSAGRVNQGDVRGGARSRQDVASPDILQLSGGTVSKHGSAIAEKSNCSPADPTIEPDGDEGNAYGDTPVQLTDMLKERLMELKAEKLQEDRNDTFLPTRLRLLPDAEVQKRLKSKSTVYCKPTEVSGHESLSGTADTLGDIAADWLYEHAKINEGGAVALEAVHEAYKPLSPAAEAVIHQSSDLTPGGSLHDPISEFASEFVDQCYDAPAPPDGSVHLLRCLPRAGFCSRREALAVIASGQVRVDNVVERNPFRAVRAENNINVSSHSGRLRFAPPRLWMYHKPAYVIVSRNDVAGRALFTKHARILGMDHLVPVGSLPMRAHGLLLLTNDGELSRFLENPRCMIQQTYLLRVRPAIDPVLAHKLNFQGVTINGKRYNNMEFLVNPAIKSRFSLKVKVRGERMPIAHLMQHLGRTVERGGRISFGPFSLSGLPVGSLREVTVPPHYTQHCGAVWKEFVERDWPFFRRQRASRLRRLARYRELTPRELEELDNFTYEELKDAFSFDAQELKTASDEWLERVSVRPMLNEQPLPNDFGTGNVHGNLEYFGEDAIVDDITALS
uniref:Putative tRNA pseudouridine synthase A n=1 Tax=Trypanosoma congolense (strain IL3000) TaxID=1068625 RepID=G0UWI3_TRYCI|nr:putative tRNA pseudouridine synthase A [Trypanosoma congolense IL3000]